MNIQDPTIKPGILECLANKIPVKYVFFLRFYVNFEKNVPLGELDISNFLSPSTVCWPSAFKILWVNQVIHQNFLLVKINGFNRKINP